MDENMRGYNSLTLLSDIDILFLVKTRGLETRRTLSQLASDYSLKYDVYRNL